MFEFFVRQCIIMSLNTNNKLLLFYDVSLLQQILNLIALYRAGGAHKKLL